MKRYAVILLLALAGCSGPGDRLYDTPLMNEFRAVNSLLLKDKKVCIARDHQGFEDWNFNVRLFSEIRFDKPNRAARIVALRKRLEEEGACPPSSPP